MISERRHHYVMIGAPVTSVRTPPLLEAFLAREGIAATVPVRHLEPADLPAFMAALRADHDIDGLMVTMPHKRAICAHLDGLSAVASRVGSVNAVKRVDGRLLGAQFDGVGLCNAVAAAGADIATATVWLKGLGGAGLAIAHTLLLRGCGSLMVSEIDTEIAAAAAPLLATAEFVGPGEERCADILVNATPIGMGAEESSPFALEVVTTAQVVADIVADPNRTRLAALTREAGVRLVTGRQMVEHQVPPIGRWLLTDDPEQDD